MVWTTRASDVTRRPPKVNVIPQTTGKPSKGGVSMGSAQLFRSGVIPIALFPSSRKGLNSPGWTAALNARTVWVNAEMSEISNCCARFSMVFALKPVAFSYPRMTSDCRCLWSKIWNAMPSGWVRMALPIFA